MFLEMLAQQAETWPLKILGSVPFVGASLVLGVSNGTDGLGSMVQYGALGISFVAVVKLFSYVDRLTEVHRVERQELITALNSKIAESAAGRDASTAAINQLSQLLKDRECVSKDSRADLNNNLKHV
jgi:hypothetical protein